MGYKIGSFNLHNLGDTALKQENPRNLKRIAQIIKQEHFDIVALQEVLKEGEAFYSEKEYQKKTILMELGGTDQWDFAWARANGKSSDPRAEGYAFVWNKKRIKLSTYKELTQFGSVEKTCEYEPRMIGSDLLFGREVLYGRFCPINLPKVEFRLINIHTSPATSKEELDIIIRQIYPRIEDEQIKEHNRCGKVYTLILGDYNVQLRRDWKVIINRFLGKSVKYLDADDDDIIIANDWNGKRIKTVQEEPTTLPQKDEDINGKNTEYRDYVNDFDHFSYDIDQFNGVHLFYDRVDAVAGYYNNNFDLYRDEISDHIPISITIDFK